MKTVDIAILMLIYKEKKAWQNFNTVLDIYHNSIESDLFQPACHFPLRQEEAVCSGQNRRGLAHSFNKYLLAFFKCYALC